MLRLAQELYRYAAYHFLSEENLMMVFNYPDLSTQQQEHEKMLQNLQIRVNDLEKGRAEMSALSDFVGEWLKNHTLIMDKKIGEYILFLRSIHS